MLYNIITQVFFTIFLKTNLFLCFFKIIEDNLSLKDEFKSTRSRIYDFK